MVAINIFTFVFIGVARDVGVIEIVIIVRVGTALFVGIVVGVEFAGFVIIGKAGPQSVTAKPWPVPLGDIFSKSSPL